MKVVLVWRCGGGRHILSQRCVAQTECCGGGRHRGRRSHVAGTDTILVSMECNTLGVLGASLFLLYDSLIEKCSTLPVV
jgi:hypothetical protein